MIRSILAVIFGYIATAIVIMLGYMIVGMLVSEPDKFPGWLVALLAIAGAGGVAGGYVAARVAPRRPLLHAAALGALMMIAGLAMAMWPSSYSAGDPTWYRWGVGPLALPMALLGGTLRRRS